MLSSCCSGNSHTARGAWSRYCPIRFRRMRSARVASRLPGCTPCKRMQCQVGQMPDMPVLLTRCDGLVAHRVPVPRGGALGFAPPGLVCGLAACSPSSATASSASRGSTSHVSPESVYVTQRFNTAASLNLAFLHQLELLIQFLQQPIEVITISSDDEIVTMLKSRVECPNAHGQLLELSRPKSVLTF